MYISANSNLKYLYIIVNKNSLTRNKELLNKNEKFYNTICVANMTDNKGVLPT